MNAIASGSSNLTVPQVLAQLKNATKPIINSPERPSQIYGGDLIAAVEILAQITEYSKHRNVSSKEDFQNIAHVASNLLEPVNSRTWMALDKVIWLLWFIRDTSVNFNQIRCCRRTRGPSVITRGI